MLNTRKEVIIMSILDKIDKYLNEESDNNKSYDVRNIEKEAIENDNFRKVLFTGNNIQLVLMSLNPGEEIGMEVHNDSDQFFRIDEGQGKLVIKNGETFNLEDGSSIVIKSGTYHNIVNTSEDKKLKLYTIYGPPHHPEGTINKTKEEAEKEELEEAVADRMSSLKGLQKQLAFEQGRQKTLKTTEQKEQGRKRIETIKKNIETVKNSIKAEG